MNRILGIILFIGLFAANSNAQIITTAAGNGTSGFSGDGGPALSAKLYNPASVAFNSIGEMIIADEFNHRLRKVDTNGVITTIAGTGVAGFSGDGGNAISAQLNYPKSVVIDKHDNIYFSDFSNGRIRKIDNLGIIKTYAGIGTGVASGDGGAAALACLGSTANNNFALAISNAGSIYFTSENKIRKIDTLGIVTSVAGSGASSFSGDGGLATNAGISQPTDIFVDSIGNLYIVDAGNYRIRKVFALNGIITTIAGNGSPSGPSGNGGQALLAAIWLPYSVAADKKGNVYFSENHSTIRRIDSNGIINTIVRTSQALYGGDNGPPYLAQISGCNDLVFDSKGNLFLADILNYRIRKITNSCLTLSLIGTNLTQACSGSTVVLKATGATSYLWDSNAGNATIDSVIVSPTVTTTYSLIGTTGVCSATMGVTITVPTMLITGNNTICAGNSTTLTAPAYSGATWSANAGGGTGASVVVSPPISATYTLTGSAPCYPTDTMLVHVIPLSTLSITGSDSICKGNSATLTGHGTLSYHWSANAGNVLTDSVNVSPNATTTYSLIGTIGGCSITKTFTVFVDFANLDIQGPTSACANNAINLVASGGNSYTWMPGGSISPNITVSPTVNTTYTVSTSNGTCTSSKTFVVTYLPICPYITTIAGNGTSGYSGDGGPAVTANLSVPYTIATDKKGNIYIYDGLHRIRKINNSSVISTIAGNGSAGYTGDGGLATLAKIDNALGMDLDSIGNLYLVDFNQNVVRRIDTSAIITTIAGTGVTGATGDGGSALSATFDRPESISTDAAGNLYITEEVSGKIRKINTNTGIINAIAGTGAMGFSGDGGLATQATLRSSEGIALDRFGNIYFTDSQDHVVRKINSAGIINTIAGNRTAGYSGDGDSAIHAQLNDPEDVAVDSIGNVFIADYNNNVVRVVDTSGIIYTIAGNHALAHGYSGDGGYSYLAQLNNPVSIAVTSDGSLVIADASNNVIRKVSYCPSPISISITSTNNTCLGDSSVLVANGASSYFWMPVSINSSTISVSPTVNTTYTVVGVNGNCAANATISLSPEKCVWPGDADENLVVDNFDLIPIGLKYSATGPARSNISNSWHGYVCKNWNDSLAGINIKYIDCNGDSTINSNDTLAINLNYGLTHSAKLANDQNTLVTNHDIYFQFNKASYYPGDTILASVFIGSNSNPQSNFYGAVFTIDYDQSKIKLGSERFYYNNSWVGNINQQMIKFSKIFPLVGKIDASLVRINHADTNGFGKIATLLLILKDTISSSQIYFTINNSLRINDIGNEYFLNSGTVNVPLIPNSVGVDQVLNNNDGLIVYPNPTSSEITIVSSELNGVVEVYNCIGKKVIDEKITSLSVHLQLPEVAGIYQIRVTGKRIYQTKVIVR